MNQLHRQSTALIMAGGTGGHIFPGIAVANSLKQKGWNVDWLGSRGGMEEQLVAGHSINLNLISVSGLRGNGITGWIAAPLTLCKAIYQAIKVLKKVKPEVVIGFGGFASGPGGIAAFLTRTPLVIHEQNAIAGFTNKVLGIFSRKIFQAFPGAFQPANKVETVGNPVRKEIEMLNTKEKKVPIELNNTESSVINVLVVGGSRGALALNKNIPVLLKESLLLGKVKVKHQVGKNRIIETQKFYAANQLANKESVVLCEFIEKMSEAFEWADIIICRAGASTVSEVSTVGICAIFVPFPYAVDDHQAVNASWLVEQGGAICVQEKELTSTSCISEINQLISQPEKINEIAGRAKNAALLNAAEKVADYCNVFGVKA